jgi:hypothetical protein
MAFLTDLNFPFLMSVAHRWSKITEKADFPFDKLSWKIYGIFIYKNLITINLLSIESPQKSPKIFGGKFVNCVKRI